MSRDDAAGLLEGAQLQGDGGANDLVLPVVGNRQSAHPTDPIVERAVAELPAGGLQITRKGFVHAEDEMHRPSDDERRLALDQRQGSIGRQAHDRAFADITDVIAAGRVAGDRMTVIIGRPGPHGDDGRHSTPGICPLSSYRGPKLLGE